MRLRYKEVNGHGHDPAAHEMRTEMLQLSTKTERPDRVEIQTAARCRRVEGGARVRAWARARKTGGQWARTRDIGSGAEHAQLRLMGRECDYETSLMGVTTKDSVLLQACWSKTACTSNDTVHHRSPPHLTSHAPWPQRQTPPAALENPKQPCQTCARPVPLSFPPAAAAVHEPSCPADPVSAPPRDCLLSSCLPLEASHVCPRGCMWYQLSVTLH